MTSHTYSLVDLGWSQHYQAQLDLDEIETFAPVRLTEVHRSSMDALGINGPVHLPMTGDLADHGVAVGDWILVETETGRPGRVLDRKSILKRRVAGNELNTQLIAANVDTLFIVSSCNADFNVARLERYLALAHQAGIDPVIILTKSDLAENPSDYRREAETSLPGTLVETVDAKSPNLVDQLSPWCSKGKTVALVGSSGVGKSTITNALTGGQSATQDIREDDAKGRHTTTSRSMHGTATGGWLIDTPGMRALRLADVSEGVEMVFQDVADLALQCRFHDCAHDTEPGCAIQAAIAAGDLDPARLVRWQKLQREDQHNTETLAEKHVRTRKRERMYKSGKKRATYKRNQYE
ncbi:MAG: ribosome small subunit-dependent GTPase A [Marinosulfonomonas sp.]